MHREFHASCQCWCWCKLSDDSTLAWITNDIATRSNQIYIQWKIGQNLENGFNLYLAFISYYLPSNLSGKDCRHFFSFSHSLSFILSLSPPFLSLSPFQVQKINQEDMMDFFFFSNHLLLRNVCFISFALKEITEPIRIDLTQNEVNEGKDEQINVKKNIEYMF